MSRHAVLGVRASGVKEGNPGAQSRGVTQEVMAMERGEQAMLSKSSLGKGWGGADFLKSIIPREVLGQGNSRI